MDLYKLKNEKIEAEKLESDVTLKHGGNKNFYIPGGNYLIKGPDGQIYPADKKLFEFLFEKEEQNE